MSAPAVLTPTARAEVTEAVAWIARNNPDAARRLRTAVGDAARLLGAHPLAGRQHPALVGERYRLWSLTGFPYLIIYDPDRHPPRIVRVVHTARDLPPLLADLRS